MGTIEYSEYPFSYQPTKNDKNDNNDKKETPVIEGIADFCSLNRKNPNTQGWNNLNTAISSKNNQSWNSNSAKKTNSILQTTTGTGTGTTGQINRYPYTCGGLYGKMFKQDGTTISPNGSVYAYSTDFKIQRGSVPVNENGEFKGLDVKLINNAEKFIFAYEDPAGNWWSVDLISGSGTSDGVSCSPSNKYFVLKMGTRRGFGDSASQSRDANGKLINTELKNSGAELRYNGMKAIYAKTIADTMNLGIGVLAAIVFITKTQ
jgi:hypothetical protein